jgi:DNA-binding response OmpR family regulator
MAALMMDERPSGVTCTEGRVGPILIIEDEIDLRNNYERLLRRLKFDVIAVERAGDALRIAESRGIGLVIADLNLPDMDGIALIRTLRVCADPPPIVVASAVDSAATRRAALEAGAVAYLTKPFSIATLTATIRDILKPVDRTAP